MGHGQRFPQRGQRLRDGLLAARVGVAVQQANCKRPGAAGRGQLCDALEFSRAELQLDLPVEQGALRDSNAHRARHQRLGAGGSQGIDVGAVLPPNLDQVLESRVGEQRHPGAVALQQRVGGDGGAVGEHTCAGVAEQRAHPFEDRGRGIVGRGKQLMDTQFAVDNGGNVGERPAGSRLQSRSGRRGAW